VLPDAVTSLLDASAAYAALAPLKTLFVMATVCASTRFTPTSGLQPNAVSKSAVFESI
jgi:hypothetical protein